MKDREVVVTGMGAVTPAGVDIARTWSTVCDGLPTAAADSDLACGPVPFSCRVKGFCADVLLGARQALRLDRSVQFALVAAGEALTDAGLDSATWDGARVGIVLGTADGGSATLERQHHVLVERGPQEVSPYLLPMQLPNMLAGRAGIAFGARGPNLSVSTACASGLTAIGLARDLLLLDRCDIVLTGGSDALLTPLKMAAFARMGALSRRVDDPASASRPFDVGRDGFVAGEGAAVLVLERAADARARAARARARVVGFGSSADAYHITSPDPQGRGIEAATRTALAEAGAGPEDVAHVNAHGTSTPLNDRVEGAMVRRVLTGGPVVTSTKGVTGHMMGGGAAAEAVLTVLAIEHGLVPPTANLRKLDPEIDIEVATVPTPKRIELALTNSFGFGGQNAVLALARA